MKAIQFAGVNCLNLVDVPAPRPGPGELLVKTGAATICGSDVNELRTGIFGSTLPIIFGHEGAGIVADVGQEVHGFQIGDRVATHPVHSCGECGNCRAGSVHLCERMRHFGLNIPGTFAEYYVCGATRARRVPSHVPFTVAALAEPICCCLQALAHARLRNESRLLILGDGPFGVLMSMLARWSAPTARLTLAGAHDFRMGFAPADHRINVRKTTDAETKLREMGPFDAAIVAAGRAAAVQQGLSLIRPKGRLVIFSAINDPTPIDLMRVLMKELEIVGSCNDEDRFDDAVGFISKYPEQIRRTITHQFSLSEYEEAFAQASRGQDDTLKVAFTFETT